MKFKNLTPHRITLFATDGTQLVIPPEPNPLRLEMKRKTVDYLPANGVLFPLTRTEIGQAYYVPPYEAGTMYIVSRMTAEAMQRSDFLVPDDIVRDAEGNIIGCRALAYVP